MPVEIPPASRGKGEQPLYGYQCRQYRSPVLSCKVGSSCITYSVMEVGHARRGQLSIATPLNFQSSLPIRLTTGCNALSCQRQAEDPCNSWRSVPLAAANQPSVNTSSIIDTHDASQLACAFLARWSRLGGRLSPAYRSMTWTVFQQLRPRNGRDRATGANGTAAYTMLGAIMPRC